MTLTRSGSLWVIKDPSGTIYATMIERDARAVLKALERLGKTKTLPSPRPGV